jgi:3',5'-nucleoside bisphosphate phosphatase
MTRLSFSRTLALTGLLLCLAVITVRGADGDTRTFPDILGYHTLKCDFHSHTVFSDGDVWPTFRVREAWLTGLDVLAITDHLESQAKQEYVKGDRNSSYKLAAEVAAAYGITLIHGGEITRSMPPGHINALFVQDCNALALPRWQDAVQEVKKQGGLLVWNHPGWENQQPDRIARWYAQHDTLMQTGILAGIEIVNSYEYYPEALQWCLDKKLAMFGNSDVHSSIYEEQYASTTAHRPMTLVFAADHSPAAIRQAIIERRTIVYFNNTLIGEEHLLRALFDSSIAVENRKVQTTGRKRVTLSLNNKYGFTFKLQLETLSPDIQYDYDVELKPGSQNRLTIRSRNAALSVAGKVRVNYKVTNMLVAPGKCLVIPLELDLDIKPQ